MAPRVKKDPNGNPEPDGVWISYYPEPDPADVAVFRSEVAALRDAVEGAKLVVRLPYGVTLSDYLHRLREETSKITKIPAQKGTSE